MGFLEIITGEMLLVPGVEIREQSKEHVELLVGGKPFAQVHSSERVDLSLPTDLKEVILARGIATRSPDHKRDGWVAIELGSNADLPTIMRLLHQSYRFTSSML
jgi:hypothetical protein